MPRQARSEIRALLDEARAMELLAAEADVSPDRMQDYWTVSADLLTLVLDIEELEASHPDASEDEPEVQALRWRLRSVAARLSELAEK